MKVDYIKHSHTWLGHALLHMMTEVCGDRNILEVFSVETGKPLEVELKVNGVEVSVYSLFDHLQKQWDHAVTKAAHELLKEKTSQLFESVGEIERKIKEMGRELLGVELDD